MLKVNDLKFRKDMDNILAYSFGFLEGMEKGKLALYGKLGPEVTALASEFIDANARMNPQDLHHVYEWYRTGSPDSRLFDFDYSISKYGISFSSTLKQSTTIKDGSKVPFYNKATIMESGVSVTIRPKAADALRFEVDGDVVYTKGQITIDNPGGNTAGKFENIVDMFFNNYFKQTFFRLTGLDKHFKNPSIYKQNLKNGKNQGRYAGIKTGYQWVASAGIGA